MTARQLFVLAILLAGGSLLTAVVPKHALFNAPGGTLVLAGMSALTGVSGILVRWRARASNTSHAN